MITQDSNKQHSVHLVIIAILAGLVAAFHMGKVPGALPYLRDFFDLSLAQSSLIISSFSIIAAVLGILMGLISARIGMFWAGTIGLLVTALGSALGASSSSFSILLLSRSIEGVGFVLVAVTMPGLINHVCPPKRRAIVMGVWGGFIPAAMSLVLITSPPVLVRSNWQGLWMLLAAISLLYTFVFVHRFHKMALPTTSITGSYRSAIWEILTGRAFWVVAAFVCYATLFVAVTTFLPTFWHSQYSQPLESASLMASIAVTGNILGNLSGGYLIHHGHTLRRLVIFALAASGICAALLFSNLLPLSLQFLMAAGFTFFAGILPGSVLASASKIVSHLAGIPILMGMIFQGAGIGQVLGPIGMGTAVGYADNWAYGSGFIILVAFLGVLCGLKIRD